MGDPVRAAADALSESMTAAADLIPERDTEVAAIITGAADGGESHPPWNSPAADAYFTGHEGVRRLRASLELALNGRAGPRLSHTPEATARELTRIKALSARLDVHEALPKKGRCSCATCTVTQLLDRWTKPLILLPAIDTGVRWSPINGDPLCPYCDTPSLRVADRFDVIACHNDECEDSEGNQPVARLARSPRTGDPAVLWNDGLVS